MSYDAFIELARQRRSIREFKPVPVTDDEINKILEAASLAPSGFNCQLWEFVVVRKQEYPFEDPDFSGETASCEF